MRLSFFYRILFVVLMLLLLPASGAKAAGTAALHVGDMKAVQNSGYVSTDIVLDSPDQSVSALSVRLSVTNLRLVDSVAIGSAFSQEITSPSEVGNFVSFARSRSDAGFVGRGAEVLRLEWQPIVTGPASVKIETEGTQVLTFKDASNILGSNTGTYGSVVYVQPLSTSRLKAPQIPAISRDTMLGEGGTRVGNSQTETSRFPLTSPLVISSLGLLIVAIILLGFGAYSFIKRMVVARAAETEQLTASHVPLPRTALALTVVGALCMGVAGFGMSSSIRQAHADFLNPSNDHILPPTNVGMEAEWVSGTGEMTTMHWTPTTGAVSYALYMNDVRIVQGITGSSYVIDPKAFNGSATYVMTATDVSGSESIPSNICKPSYTFDPTAVPNWVSLNAPSVPHDPVVSAQWNLGKPRIFLAWQGGAQYFKVYRDGLLLANYQSSMTYVDSDVVPGSIHTYEVSSVNSFAPKLPESARSVSVSMTALTAQPTYSATPIEVTKVIPNDDSAVVFFTPIVGASDYRIYSVSNPMSIKYAGSRVYSPTEREPAPYSIEMNGLSPNSADLVVEAVDKFGPFQKADGFAGPGSAFGTSINGQSEPSNVPNVLARSKPFHVTMHPASLAGSQVFFDNFRNEQPLQDVINDPAITAIAPPNSYYDLKTVKNDKWSITSYGADTSMTRNFFMGNHFMETVYDGPSYDKAPFSHNNNTSNVIAPIQTADMSGGKVLHITMEVDARFDGRRWTDVMVGQAGDPLTAPRPTKLDGGFPTKAGNLFSLDINAGGLSMEYIHPTVADPLHTVQTDLIQATDWTDGHSVSRSDVGQLGINGTSQDLDKRHTFDLFLSSNHYKVVETAPDGTQIFREKDFPAGISLPFTTAQVYFTHEVYHTSNDVGELEAYSGQSGSDVTGASAQYWYNYRPYSDERHWDNMGFSILNSFAEAVVTPLPAFAPDYAGVGAQPLPTPTPTAVPSTTPAVSFDLNGNGKKDLADIVFAIRAFNGLPNAAALVIWPPDGNPTIRGIVDIIRWFQTP